MSTKAELKEKGGHRVHRVELKQKVDIVSTEAELKQKGGHRVHQSGAKTKSGHRVHRVDLK